MFNKDSYRFSASVLVVLALGCSQPAPTSKPADQDSSQTAANTTTAAPSDGVKKKLLDAKDALLIKLSGKLMQTMSEQGAVAAIAVCQQEAPLIAKTISEQHGVQIGRVGVRLRNPNNHAPDWATTLVESKTDTPTFLSLENGEQAALLPIKLQATCLTCHGPKEQIAADVLAAISERYPEDQATGFQEGELRGWFWVVDSH